MKWTEAKKSGDNMNGQDMRDRVGPTVLRACFFCTAILWVACSSGSETVNDSREALGLPERFATDHLMTSDSEAEVAYADDGKPEMADLGRVTDWSFSEPGDTDSLACVTDDSKSDLPTCSLNLLGNLRGSPKDVDINDEYAFLAMGYGGVWIVDLSNPAEPMIVSKIDLDDNSRSIVVESGNAFVTNSNSRLFMANVESPDNPSIVGSIDIGEQVSPLNGVAPMLDRLLAVGKGGLSLIDVEEIAAPSIVAHLPLDDVATAVVLQDGLGYVSVCPMQPTACHILSLEVGGPGGLTPSGLSGSIPRVVVGLASVGEHILAVGGTVLTVLSVDGEGGVEEVSSEEIIGEARDLVVLSGRAFVSLYDDAFEGGVQVFDIEDPAAPVALGTLAGDLSNTDCLAATEWGLGICHRYGVDLFDVGVSPLPARIGRIPMPEYGNGLAMGDKYAYAGTSRGLVILDVSAPPLPLPTANLDFEGNFGPGAGPARAVKLDGQRLYLVMQDAGLLVFDVEEPSSPLLTGVFDPPEAAWDFAADADLGVLLAYDTYLLDLSDPGVPLVADLYPSSGLVGPSAVEISADIALLVSGGGVRALRMSSSQGLELLDDLSVGGDDGCWLDGTAVLASKLFLTCGPDGLAVVDISDPSELQFDGMLDVGGWATAVTVGDGLVLVGTGAEEGKYGGLLHVLKSMPQSEYEWLATMPMDASPPAMVFASPLLMTLGNSPWLYDLNCEGVPVN
jgi:hypothetical protein